TRSLHGLEQRQRSSPSSPNSPADRGQLIMFGASRRFSAVGQELDLWPSETSRTTSGQLATPKRMLGSCRPRTEMIVANSNSPPHRLACRGGRRYANQLSAIAKRPAGVPAARSGTSQQALEPMYMDSIGTLRMESLGHSI